MRSIFTYCFVALLAVANHAQGARILGLFPHTGKSHQMVFEPLLKKLAERGHQVTVVSFFPQKSPPANYTDVSLVGISDIGLGNLDLNMFEHSNNLLKILGLDNFFGKMACFGPLDEMALHTCKKLVNFPSLQSALKKKYDLVLVENFNSDCMLGLLHVYGIDVPAVALSSSGVPPWTPNRIGSNDNPSHVPQFCLDFTTEMTFLERLQNTFFTEYYKYWFRHSIQLKEQEVIEKHFGRKIPDLQELAKKTSMFMVNTHHSLNGVRPLLPGIIEVGGMHLDHSRKPIPRYIERFLNESDEGVVVFSFGSLIRTSTLPKYKEEILINAVSKLKQRVIWKYEDSEEEGTLSGNILKVKWIPQFELLKHPKVVAYIAHGGLLGMTEAIHAGKPMLIVPFFGDQPNNGAMAQAVGLGKMVNYATLNKKDFEDALQKVLSAEMRLSARRISSIWRDRPMEPLDTAVYWVERLARWGHHDPLHSSARDLSYIQYALLDVAAAFVAAILVCLLILKLIFSLVPWLLGFGSKKQKLH